MARVSQFVKLYTGARMPAMGLGTFDSLDKAKLQESVDNALGIGYRHIDTAASYTNESHIGEALSHHLNDGKFKREDLFVTTKVPSNMIGSERDIMRSANQSLEALKLKYVDMLLVHMPFGFIKGASPKDDLSRIMVHYDILGAWKAMEKLFKDGKAKAIGVSNFTPRQLDRLLNVAEIKPANLQLECHAYCQQRELREYCRQRGIVVSGYSPIGAPGRPAKQREEGDRELIKDPAVVQLAQTTGKTEAQVLLRFLIQLGVVPLPKSSSPERLAQNLDMLTGDFSLDDSAMNKLQGITYKQKYFRFLWARGHPEYFPDESF